MSEELCDEVTSINSIYGEGTLCRLDEEENKRVYALSLPAQPQISLRIEFPVDYPDAPPSVLGTQHVGDEIAKGEGSAIVDLTRAIVAEQFNPGVPCIFDLLEESSQRLEHIGLDQRSRHEGLQAAQTNGQEARHDAPSTITAATTITSTASSDEKQQQPVDEPQLDGNPPWHLSETITEKKSIFLARAAPVQSVEEARRFLAHLLATDKKAAKATHNISAWRIRGGGGVQYQDCDDDGEDAAGGRLLHLLERMNVWGAMVVVSRWYGGVKLGPDRFRIINQCAREAIVKGGLLDTPTEDDQQEDGKRKRKGKR